MRPRERVHTLCQAARQRRPQRRVKITGARVLVPAADSATARAVVVRISAARIVQRAKKRRIRIIALVDEDLIRIAVKFQQAIKVGYGQYRACILVVRGNVCHVTVPAGIATVERFCVCAPAVVGGRDRLACTEHCEEHDGKIGHCTVGGT